MYQYSPNILATRMNTGFQPSEGFIIACKYCDNIGIKPFIYFCSFVLNGRFSVPAAPLLDVPNTFQDRSKPVINDACLIVTKFVHLANELVAIKHVHLSLVACE